MEDPQLYCERSISFEGLDILNDSQNVCYTYQPKDKAEIKMQEKAAELLNKSDMSSEMLDNSSDTDNSKLKDKIRNEVL